ncbi:MAG: 2-amino-4-hydroxy-6-hydroxymethyldihydropteridine diphosphokinase [Ardenticatenaceae bacterium]|nr:2-amino-4-hydroxy-6-hydroxymethyldihydropteridine diphosphokinase [Ardenticatenaceae bacterium]
MNTVYLILGSNINKEVNLPEAVRLLRELTTVVQVAGVYETVPVGLLEQPLFWNTAVSIHTPLAPAALKVNVLAAIEHRLQRVRQADKNAPRTIDLDIVLFNDWVQAYDPGDGRFRPIPDPDLLQFPHVAVPIAELAPNMPHPVTGEPLQAIADRLLQSQQKAGWTPLLRRSDIIL